jgi:hypothetical protein
MDALSQGCCLTIILNWTPGRKSSAFFLEAKMKFIKPFKGATSGNAFAQDFAIGDECPSDLEDAAVEDGAIEIQVENPPMNKTTKARPAAPETKQA